MTDAKQPLWKQITSDTLPQLKNIPKILPAIFSPTAIYSVDPDKLPEETQHLLSAYVDAELDGKDAAGLFPDVHEALDEHPEFAQEYYDLYELLLSGRRGELEEPPITPTFDFSHLVKDDTK